MAFEGYNRTFWGHGGKATFKPVANPNPALGIGEAEDLSPQTLKISYMLPNSDQPSMREVLSSMDGIYDDMDRPYTVDEFPQWGWVGDAYGGDGY